MRYVSRAAGIEAMQWYRQHIEQYDLAARANEIVAWVKNNGGEARFYPDELAAWTGEVWAREEPKIGVHTIDGWTYAMPGHYIVMGSTMFHRDGEKCPDPHSEHLIGPHIRNFYLLSHEAFEQDWVAAP